MMLAVLLLWPWVAQDDKIEDLIRRLGAVDSQEKEAVERELKALGEKAIPYLRKAAESTNKKLQQRAQKLLEELQDAEDPGGGIGAGGAFGSRFGGRANLVARGGGSRATEQAVQDALQWLARHQSPDGSWKAAGFRAQCVGPEICTGLGEATNDVGLTGLATLAFVGAGFTHLSKDERGFGTTVKNALQWLMATQDADGCIGARDVKFMYGHAVAAAALAETFGMSQTVAIREPAQKAIDFLVAAQNPGKGWRYSEKCGDNDTSVTGWAVAALKAAETAGLSFPAPAKEGALAWLNEATDEKNGFITGYTRSGTGKVYVAGKNEQFEHHPTMSAISIWCRIVLKKDKKDPALAAADALAADPPEWKANKIDFYYWYHASLAAFQFDGPDGPVWKKWNEPMKDAILPNQRTRKDGCAKGSWSPEEERWGFEGGRVYATAINALTLETYYRYPATLKAK